MRPLTLDDLSAATFLLIQLELFRTFTPDPHAERLLLHAVKHTLQLHGSYFTAPMLGAYARQMSDLLESATYHHRQPPHVPVRADLVF